MDGSELLGLCNWYQEQCDGHWEHGYGVRIETLDNPGWMLHVNLTGTHLQGKELPQVLVEVTDDDWYCTGTREGKFEAAGDPTKLPLLIAKFLEFSTGPRH